MYVYIAMNTKMYSNKARALSTVTCLIILVLLLNSCEHCQIAQKASSTTLDQGCN